MKQFGSQITVIMVTLTMQNLLDHRSQTVQRVPNSNQCSEQCRSRSTILDVSQVSISYGSKVMSILRKGVYRCQDIKSSLIIKQTSTFIYHSIENFTGYKMVYKTLRKNVTLYPTTENTLRDLDKSAHQHQKCTGDDEQSIHRPPVPPAIQYQFDLVLVSTDTYQQKAQT